MIQDVRCDVHTCCTLSAAATGAGHRYRYRCVHRLEGMRSRSKDHEVWSVEADTVRYDVRMRAQLRMLRTDTRETWAMELDSMHCRLRRCGRVNATMTEDASTRRAHE